MLMDARYAVLQHYGAAVRQKQRDRSAVRVPCNDSAERDTLRRAPHAITRDGDMGANKSEKEQKKKSYSGCLLYWCDLTNTDAAGAAGVGDWAHYGVHAQVLRVQVLSYVC